MNFELTEEQQMVRDAVREFAEAELWPRAAELDESREFPWETVRKMGELGFLAAPIPEEYGGAGMDSITYLIIGMEVSRCCAAHATILGAHCSLTMMPLLEYGTEEQKKKYLPKLTSGEWLGAFSLTEPDAGSDASNLQTIAVKDGEHYVINGKKMWCTNGNEAGMIILLANTNPRAGLRGITPFIVEKGTPGFNPGHIENTMGIRGSHQAELNIENLRVHESQILGGPRNIGRGFSIAMKTLDGGRVGVAGASIGIAQMALELAVKYAKQRVQFGQPIGNFQAVQMMIADMATEIEAARYLSFYAAWLKDQHKPVTAEAAMAKLFASEVAWKATDLSLQVHGGYGYSKEYPIERLMRDARIKRIYEGTNEIQRMVIAREVLRRYK